MENGLFSLCLYRMTAALWQQQDNGTASFKCSPRVLNSAAVICYTRSRAVIKAKSHKSVVFWIETAPATQERWRRGHLSNRGSWEIESHISIFNTWVIFFFFLSFFSHEDNVRVSSVVRIWIQQRNKPKQMLIGWMLFRGKWVWHSSCSETVRALWLYGLLKTSVHYQIRTAHEVLLCRLPIGSATLFWLGWQVWILMNVMSFQCLQGILILL